MSNIAYLNNNENSPLVSHVVDEALGLLQKQIAQRVRQARSHANMSRRMLSEKSGVSQRYLAQLEAGEGNVSVGLLLRVAMSLNLRLEWLVGDIEPLDVELANLNALYRNTSPEKRAMLIEQLRDLQFQHDRANRICFVGLRGAGKSTLGAIVAEDLNIPFLELNDQIEKLAGIPVGEIIALYGQEGYRRLEREAVQSVLENYDRVLMAAAGGVVEDAETYDAVLAGFHTVWLRANADDHMARVREQGDERPMAGHPAAMEQLKKLLKERETAYSRADVQLNTSDMSFDEGLKTVVQLIKKKGFLA